MKLRDFNYIFHTIEDEIKEGVELVEGVEPTIAELLEYHIKENDENFLTWIFEDYDEERGDINSLDDLTEDEVEQVNKLIQYCKDTYHVIIDDCDMSTKWMAGGMTFEEAKDYVDGLTPDEYEGYEGGVAIVYSDITEDDVYHIDLQEKEQPSVVYIGFNNDAEPTFIAQFSNGQASNYIFPYLTKRNRDSFDWEALAKEVQTDGDLSWEAAKEAVEEMKSLYNDSEHADIITNN